MPGNQRIWMTAQEYARLQAELAELRSRRADEIQNQLADAVIGEKDAGDPVAEPGMVLTIRYDGTGELETFLLGRRGAKEADIKVYSMAHRWAARSPVRDSVNSVSTRSPTTGRTS
ncbi:GreA/GreB family elongation factor [Actinosynnema mirum DSM] [Mycobacterium shimoidei]|uniref:GreA/GreB family elongation factor [Actinosynnema mirum DSM] n=1 Tax=Mycobacterium shimoidei TaxID=29313 RepID=A0A375YSW6_MYCSH|nr:GreA/GreB family elongation factor [Actinosynnema mirum DSM] [Mycobacterium shimoidei]